MLGTYVENLIQDELKLDLNEAKMICKLDIDNEQGGQDFIVYVNDTPLYFIEVKSRWNKRDSVLMSKLQMEISANQKEQYALIVADMSDFPREKVERHEYPDDITETFKNMKIALAIGYKNKDLVDNLVLDETDVHIGGDYKSVIPQSYLNSSDCVQFEELIKRIKEVILDSINQSDDNVTTTNIQLL